MDQLQPFSHHESPSSSMERQYAELLERSREARARGEHWEAQKFATAAHKLAMDEHTRIQRLDQARAALNSADRQLQVAWDKDRECETVDELLERHPEFKRVITVWQNALQRVRELDVPETAEISAPQQKSGLW